MKEKVFYNFISNFNSEIGRFVRRTNVDIERYKVSVNNKKMYKIVKKDIYLIKLII